MSTHDAAPAGVRSGALQRGARLSTRTKVRRGDRAALALFLGPNLAAYFLFIILPTLTGAVLSLFEWDLFTTPKWVGFDNYATLLKDPAVPDSTLKSLLFIACGVAPTILVGFLIAVLVNWRARGIASIRVLFLLPMVVSTTVAGVLWSNMFDARNGVVNGLLGVVGLKGPAWLSSTAWALPALTVVIMWISLPLVIILYLAGLQRIPPQIYEAAALDGAGVWTRMWRITWPCVSSTTLLVAGLELLQYLAAPFEVSLIMTAGGPLDSTRTLSLYAFQQAFDQNHVGYASALSMAQFMVILGGITVTWLVARRRRA